MTNTLRQFDEVIMTCRDVFVKKTKDYGTSWRIFRLTSLTDQLYIKAVRIRNLEELPVQKVADDEESEYRGLINYCIIGLIQIKHGASLPEEIETSVALKLFDEQVTEVRNLLEQKNHDYGEVWRDMRVSSMTDMILVKLKRVKQIEDNNGSTIVSEGIASHYQDIINYSVFALIKLSESHESNR